jgi:peptidyl-prolyl cis-trans isomerase SurA
MARRARQSPADFARALTSAGINVDAFKMRVRADIAWQQIIRGKFRGNFHIRERDIFAALQSRSKDDETVGYEYTLRPILFIVPRGSPESVVAARRREADGLRARFESCDQGLRLARGLVDIAIRDQIVRTSDDFNAQLRELLEQTPVGRLTPPEQTAQGIEFYAVCAKERTVGATPGKREVQDAMMKERFDAQGERYLKELRRSAMIEYR